MRKNLTKYPIITLSLAVTFGFIFSSISLCSLMILNCDIEEVTCCVETSEESNTCAKQSENDYCCKITEAPKQSADTVPSSYEINKKQNTFLTNYSFANLSYVDDIKSSSDRMSIFHSPPKQDIYLLNSNFRI